MLSVSAVRERASEREMNSGAKSVLVATELGGREGGWERERDAHHQPESAVMG